jgi:putative NADPH-quinone reductase
MKILAINSSFRGSKGFSKHLIDHLFQGAREKGAECELVNLTELKLNHCIDCQVCQKPTHFLKCVFNDKDDVEMIYKKMREADILIFATPVYTMGMSSLLKTLLERYYSTAKVGEFSFTKSGLYFHHVDPGICKKPFVVLAICDNPESEMTKNIVSFFKTYSKFMDAESVGMLVRRSVGMFCFNKPKPNNSPIVLNVYDAYIQAGRELGEFGRITKQTQKKTNQPLIKIPIFVKLLLKLGFGKEKIIEQHKKVMQSIIDRD